MACRLALPKGLEPLLETFLQGLLQGSPEVREAAADAIGEAVALTPPDALRPFVVKVTGPLIRIVGDRFAPPVKAAILRALGAVIGKAGPGLKPFVPQLQTTFLKCLPDAESDIRMQARRRSCRCSCCCSAHVALRCFHGALALPRARARLEGGCTKSPAASTSCNACNVTM